MSVCLFSVALIIIVIIITNKDKYSDLAAHYLFQPIAVETLGPINQSASDFFSLLAKKIKSSFRRRVRDSFFVPARFRASAAIQRRAATRFVCV